MVQPSALAAALLVSLFTLAFGQAFLNSIHVVKNTSKAGLAWPNGNSVDMGQYRVSGKVSWYYSWSPYAVETDLEFVPMLWGQKSVHQFASTIQQTVSQLGVKAVLGMNEPQERGQSNLTPDEGAEMWKAYLEPLRAQGIRLGSPAPSSAPSGKTWLQAFLAACGDGCTVDFIALHYYDVNATQFIEYLNDYYSTFQRPLWVTEWACQNFNELEKQCSQNGIVEFLNKTQAFMDNSAFVERYAWFGAMKALQGVNQDNALMDSKGKINALGKQYIGTETSGGGNADGPNATSNGGGATTGRAIPGCHRLCSVTIFLFSMVYCSFV